MQFAGEPAMFVLLRGDQSAAESPAHVLCTLPAPPLNQQRCNQCSLRQHQDGRQKDPAGILPPGWNRPELHDAAGRQRGKLDTPILQFTPVVSGRADGQNPERLAGPSVTQDLDCGVGSLHARLAQLDQRAADDSKAQLIVKKAEDRHRARRPDQGERRLFAQHEAIHVAVENTEQDRSIRAQPGELLLKRGEGHVVRVLNQDAIGEHLQILRRQFGEPALVLRGAEHDQDMPGGWQQVQNVFDDFPVRPAVCHHGVALARFQRFQSEFRARSDHRHIREYARTISQPEFHGRRADRGHEVGRRIAVQVAQQLGLQCIAFAVPALLQAELHEPDRLVELLLECPHEDVAHGSVRRGVLIVAVQNQDLRGRRSAGFERRSRQEE